MTEWISRSLQIHFAEDEKWLHRNFFPGLGAFSGSGMGKDATKQPDGLARRDLGGARANCFWFTEIMSSPKIKNISLLQKCKSAYMSAHPVPLRGAYHDRHDRWDGSRWTLVVPITNGARAYGKDVWS